MPAKQLRCDVYVSGENDPTGEHAIKCGAIALACADCGDSAGCMEHALACPNCGNSVCEFCAEEHCCQSDATDIAA